MYNMWFFFIFRLKFLQHKLRGKYLSPPTISCCLFLFGCWRRWIWRVLTSLGQSSKEWWHSRAWETTLFLPPKEFIGMSRQWLKSFPGRDAREVSVTADVAPERSLRGGLDDGQGRSRANLSRRSQQWPRLFLAHVTSEVLGMAEVVLEQGLWEGLGNYQGQSQVKMSRRFRQWSRSLSSHVKREVSTMAKLAPRPTCQGHLNDGQDHSWAKVSRRFWWWPRSFLG